MEASMDVVIMLVLVSAAILLVKTESKTTVPFDICSFIFFSSAVFEIFPAEPTTDAVSFANSLLKHKIVIIIVTLKL